MQKTTSPHAETGNIITFLAVLLTLLWVSSYSIVDYTLVFADLIQNNIPSTEALLKWVTVC